MKDILVNAVCAETWVAYAFSYAPAEIGQTQNSERINGSIWEINSDDNAKWPKWRHSKGFLDSTITVKRKLVKLYEGGYI